MNDRERLFDWLRTCPVKWEVNFDDFELLSVNYIYDSGEDKPEGDDND